VIGFERSSRRKRGSSNVNGVSWVHDVLGTEYLRLLAELQVPVQGGRRDPPGRRPSSRHRLHGEYVRERAIVGLTIKQFYAARGALGVTVSNRPIATWKGRLLFCIVGAAMILVGVRFFWHNESAHGLSIAPSPPRPELALGDRKRIVVFVVRDLCAKKMRSSISAHSPGKLGGIRCAVSQVRRLESIITQLFLY
jgi:hypothetical protein